MLQIPVATVMVDVLAEVEVEVGIEETVMKECDSDVDNVQVRPPTSLNSKRTQLVVKAQL